MSPLAFNIFRTIQTTLDLNGPTLSFTTNPTSLNRYSSGIATFVGVATATFPTNQTERVGNTGSISYQWYDQNGAITDGTNVTGSGTTTLTISNLDSPTDNQRNIYLQADYIPSAYGVGKSTGNAINDNLNSNTVLLTVYPDITITTQPVEQTVGVGGEVTFTASATLSDSLYAPLKFQWFLNDTPLTNSSSPTVEGATTTSLTIEQTTVGVSTVKMRAYTEVSGQTIEVFTNNVEFTGVEARKIIKFEAYNSSNQYKTQEVEITDSNTFSLDSSIFGTDYNIIQFYAPEASFDLKLSLLGAKGADRGSYFGGQGGQSVISFKIEKDVEYTILGVADNSSVNLYRGSNLIIVSGKGGDAGTNGNGGSGGGANVAGENGSGSNAGEGGSGIPAGSLTLNGNFGSVYENSTINLQSGDSIASSPNGGRTISCTKGSYWINQGVSPCSDNSSSKIKYRGIDGTEITQSDDIIRGFKPGYTISNTSGKGLTNGGNGGSGASGGQGGTAGSGGGGGSGYTDGSTTLLSSLLGGNSSSARVSFEL